MRKGFVLALAAVFCLMAVGTVVVAADGMKTVDQPAEKWPAKKLKAGAKKKPPVTFNHDKHGADNGCTVCHHTAEGLTAENAATMEVKSCFSCHGPEAKDKQLDTYKMIHDKKVGKCLKCHNEKKDSGAPTKCKACHVE